MSTRFDEKISVILHLMGVINEEQYYFLSGLHQFADDQVIAMLLDQSFAKKNDIFLPASTSSGASPSRPLPAGGEMELLPR